MNRFLILIGGFLTLLSSCENNERSGTSSDTDSEAWALEIPANLQREQYITLNSLDRASLPYFGDFLKLYPDASFSYKPLGRDVVNYTAKALLHDRYEVKLSVPVHLSEDGKELEEVGFFICVISEILSVKDEDGGITTSYGDHHEVFELDKLFETNGDFSAQGINLIEDQPVQDIHLIRKVHKSESDLIEIVIGSNS